MSPDQILVVDDDPAITEMLTLVLEDAGYVVQAATDGCRGLAVLRTQAPTVVIVDQRMPGMTGSDFLQAARRFGSNAALIGMSADDRQYRQGYPLAFDAYVTKPFDIDELLATVGSFMLAARSARDARRVQSGSFPNTKVTLSHTVDTADSRAGGGPLAPTRLRPPRQARADRVTYSSDTPVFQQDAVTFAR